MLSMTSLAFSISYNIIAVFQSQKNEENLGAASLKQNLLILVKRKECISNS